MRKTQRKTRKVSQGVKSAQNILVRLVWYMFYAHKLFLSLFRVNMLVVGAYFCFGLFDYLSLMFVCVYSLPVLNICIANCWIFMTTLNIWYCILLKLSSIFLLMSKTDGNSDLSSLNDSPSSLIFSIFAWIRHAIGR